VTLLAAFIFLQETLQPVQWIGVLILLTSALLSRWDTQVRDSAYRPLFEPTPLGGFVINRDPLTPNRFSTVSRLYRRRPRASFDPPK
jgi:hypothetical protein